VPGVPVYGNSYATRRANTLGAADNWTPCGQWAATAIIHATAPDLVTRVLVTASFIHKRLLGSEYVDGSVPV
jgi:hypothetical protein